MKGKLTLQQRLILPIVLLGLVTLLSNILAVFSINNVNANAGTIVDTYMASGTKLEDSPLSVFILAVFCNILIYLAVESYRNNPHQLGKYLGMLLGVSVFVLAGLEHCVANMFYFTAGGAWSLHALLYIGIMTVGNALGGVLFPLCRKLKAYSEGK